MSDTYKQLTELLEKIFGPGVPSWVPVVAGSIVLVWSGLKFLPKLIVALDDIRKVLAERIVPLFYKKEYRIAAEQRRRLAGVLLQRLATLNQGESFSDGDFTELEAEVEVRGLGENPRLIWNWLWGRDNRTRLVKSLSMALRKSRAKIILLEGDPGSGKSTAVRHLAIQMAQKAVRSKSRSSVLPVYVNFREFQSAVSDPPNLLSIQNYVLNVLTGSATGSIPDESLKKFVESEFDRNRQSGGWLFLFDSFDETPTVLRSTDFGLEVRNLGLAIERFLEFSGCTGVVCSRPYRSPSQFGWTHFHILPLSRKRQTILMTRSRLDRTQRFALMEWLANSAGEGLAELAENPMFLWLLCRSWRDSSIPPTAAFQVYDDYFLRRFRKEKEKFSAFEVTENQVREAAELIAYAMSATGHWGLSSPLEPLKAEIRRLVVRLPAHFDRRIGALMDARVLRQIVTTCGEEVRFEHRRFQEYFATGYLLKHPSAISGLKLLTNSNWREAAVVLLQRQVPFSTNLMLIAAEALLKDELAEQFQPDASGISNAWPGSSYHILKLLGESQINQRVRERAGLQTTVDRIIMEAWVHGRHDDKQSSASLLGIAGPHVVEKVVEELFQPSGSLWIQEAAVMQFSKINLEQDIKQKCLRLIVGALALNYRLGQMRHIIGKSMEYKPEHKVTNGLMIVLSYQRIYYVLVVCATIGMYCIGTCSLQVSVRMVFVLAFFLTSVLAFTDRKYIANQRCVTLKSNVNSLWNIRESAYMVVLIGVFLGLCFFPPRDMVAAIDGFSGLLDFKQLLFFVLILLIMLMTWCFSISIIKLCFLPSDGIKSFLFCGTHLRDLDNLNPMRQMALFAFTVNPLRPLEDSSGHVRMIHLMIGAILMVLISSCGDSGFAFYTTMLCLVVSVISMLILIFEAAFKPIVRWVRDVYYRVYWLTMLPVSPDSLPSSRFYELLVACRSASSVRFLISRLLVTRSVEANDRSVEILAELLIIGDPKNVLSSKQAENTIDQSALTLIQGLRDFKSKVLANPDNDLLDDLARLLNQTKSFLPK